jgi:hypothetical protein
MVLHLSEVIEHAPKADPSILCKHCNPLSYRQARSPLWYSHLMARVRPYKICKARCLAVLLCLESYGP